MLVKTGGGGFKLMFGQNRNQVYHTFRHLHETGADAVCTFTNSFTQVLGTVVTRPADTVVQPSVLGTSASRLPATGFQGRIIFCGNPKKILSGKPLHYERK
jgi:hypothetical protein